MIDGVLRFLSGTIISLVRPWITKYYFHSAIRNGFFLFHVSRKMTFVTSMIMFSQIWYNYLALRPMGIPTATNYFYEYVLRLHSIQLVDLHQYDLLFIWHEADIDLVRNKFASNSGCSYSSSFVPMGFSFTSTTCNLASRYQDFGNYVKFASIQLVHLWYQQFFCFCASTFFHWSLR